MIDNYNTGNVKTRNTSIKDSILKRFMYIDTLLLARYLIPNDRVNQPSLCKRYNIKNTDEHRSMGDVKSLIEIYITICEQLSYTKKHSNKNYYLENTEKVLEELFI
jgi:DNA polymerase III epsilon subunit-like protein